MHYGMQYYPIQGQGHKPLKVRNSAIFKGYLGIPWVPSHIYNGACKSDHRLLN